MIRLETSIVINRPIEEVFTYVTNLENNIKWMTGVIAAHMTSAEPIKQGSTYKFNIKTMGMTMETSGEVTAYERPGKYAWKATSGPFPMSGMTTFEPAEGGTRVTDMIEAEPGGFFKLAEPLLMKQQQGQMEADMKKLKEILEV
ncbi:MAG: SRPBCC family protein [Chloroflexota bacterium]